MAAVATIVSKTRCSLLDHGKKSTWLWYKSEPGLVMLSRGKETREYRVVEKVGDRQYRVTLEDSIWVS